MAGKSPFVAGISANNSTAVIVPALVFQLLSLRWARSIILSLKRYTDCDA